jgi:hypothetical protein
MLHIRHGREEIVEVLAAGFGLNTIANASVVIWLFS